MQELFPKVRSLIARLGSRVFFRKRTTQVVGGESNPLMAYRCFDGELFSLHPSDERGRPLPDELFVSPGNVEIDNKVFALNDDGIYRFYRLPGISEQRIVCQGGIDSLLRMIGYLWAYGNPSRNESRTLYESLTKKVSVASCTELAFLAQKILSSASFESRVVVTVTSKDWGGYDDGHTMLEIFSEDAGWFVYDPSFNCCFISKKKRLSLIELVNALHQGEVYLEDLPGNCGHRNYALNGHDLGFWVDQRMLSREMLIDWYRRIGAVPLICKDNNYYYPCHTPAMERIEQHFSQYHAMDQKTFMDEFYPSSSVSV